MPILAKIGTFQHNASLSPGQIHTISGVGFQPKGVLFFHSGYYDSMVTASGGGLYAGNTWFSIGAATASGRRWNVGALVEDASSTEPNRYWQRTDSCIYYFTDWSNVNGIYDFNRFTSDGFELVVDDQFSGTGAHIGYLALGGDTLTNIVASSFLSPIALGTYDIYTGFKPDAIIFANGMSSDENIGGTGYPTDLASYGFATSPTKQYCVAGHDNSGNSTAWQASISGECASVFSYLQNNLTFRDSFVEFTVSGFKLNHLQNYAGVQRRIYFLAMQGGTYDVGAFNSRMDGNDITIANIGFQPKAVLFLSGNIPLTTASGIPNNRRSFGVATSTSSRLAFANYSENTPTDDAESCDSGFTTEVYTNLAHDAVISQMDIKSFDTTGITCVMDDVDVQENSITYLAIGDSMQTGVKSGFVSGSGFSFVPSSDISAGVWKNEANGDSLYPSISDLSDSTYVYIPSGSIEGDYFEVELSNPTGTVSGIHIMAWKAYKKAGSQTTTLKCELRQDSTVIASDTQIISDGSAQEFNKQLTASEITNITNYNNLRIRVTIVDIT